MELQKPLFLLEHFTNISLVEIFLINNLFNNFATIRRPRDKFVGCKYVKISKLARCVPENVKELGNGINQTISLGTIAEVIKGSVPEHSSANIEYRQNT